MKASLRFFLLFICVSTLLAHTGGQVDFVCPIDDHKFSSYQDFSGTSFGAQLDLKQTGPIAQPWALPDCPKCHFVIFDREASKEEISKLRPFILSEAYQSLASRSSYYRLAAIQEHQKKDAFDIAWSYVRASWQNESSKADYAACLEKALGAFAAASSELSKDTAKHDEYLIASYMPIELLRRLSRFDDAAKAVSSFPEIGKTEIEWLPQVLKYQKQLIEKKDAAIHEIAEAMPK